MKVAVLAWGVVIYAIMFLTWNGLAIYGLSNGIIPRLFQLAVLIAVMTVAARTLRFTTWHDILPYSLSWAVIVALLDAVFAVPFGGWQIYQDWNIWVGYTLVAVLPLLAPYARRIPGHEEMP